CVDNDVVVEKLQITRPEFHIKSELLRRAEPPEYFERMCLLLRQLRRLRIPLRRIHVARIKSAEESALVPHENRRRIIGPPPPGAFSMPVDMEGLIKQSKQF